MENNLENCLIIIPTLSEKRIFLRDKLSDLYGINNPVEEFKCLPSS
jgi:hypothetical protein